MNDKITSMWNSKPIFTKRMVNKKKNTRPKKVDILLFTGL